MDNAINWRGSAEFHPSTFIQDEMDARNWTRDRMATAMAAVVAGDPSRMRVKLDIYFLIGPTDDRLRLGETGHAIAGAFGVSRELFINLENSWLCARGVEPTPSTADPAR